MRVILASNRGTLMELGISPIVTSGWTRLQEMEQRNIHGHRYLDNSIQFLTYHDFDLTFDSKSELCREDV